MNDPPKHLRIALQEEYRYSDKVQWQFHADPNSFSNGYLLPLIHSVARGKHLKK